MLRTKQAVATEELIEQLTQLPTQPTAALRVLWLLDDPEWRLGDLAQVIEADPALSARVIHLANAPFYGLTSQVGTAVRAVSVLGQATVRALAAISASGLLDGSGRAVPDGFWAHATATAAGATVAARVLQIPSSEAFTAGLLHDIGVALLHRYDTERYAAVLKFTELDPHAHRDYEQQVFGTDHAHAGAAALRAWRFPAILVAAVRQHHEPDGVLDPLTGCVIAGEALADAAGFGGAGSSADPEEALARAGSVPQPVDPLVEDVRSEIEALTAIQGWGA